ncbi:MAG: NAD(+)/NADH kinase [Alphaproteobacteria bacterium]|nr:NAD(+)/NADH kinase [Alphaproteobacteria bacterium]
MRRRFLLLHNPVAGLRRHRLVRKVVRELEERGADVVMLRLWGLSQHLSQEALERIVKFDQFDALIAAGGDGTVRALAKALGANASVPIGVIPAGTGNVLARELPLPSRPHDVAEMLLHGPVAEIPGALAGGEPFFLMAGVGFDGEIIGGLNLELKRRIGKSAYAWPTTKALAHRPKLFSVLVDDIPYTANWVVGAKARRYAGGFTIANDISVKDARLVAVLFQATSYRGRLLELTALGLGLHQRLATVAVIPCQKIEVVDAGLPVQIDGDEAGFSPVTIRMGGGHLRMIVPTEAG